LTWALPKKDNRPIPSSSPKDWSNGWVELPNFGSSGRTSNLKPGLTRVLPSAVWECPAQPRRGNSTAACEETWIRLRSHRIHRTNLPMIFCAVPIKLPNSFLASAEAGAKSITSPNARAYRSSGWVRFSVRARAYCSDGFQARKAGYWIPWDRLSQDDRTWLPQASHRKPTDRPATRFLFLARRSLLKADPRISFLAWRG
jgi:hypothetical protein